MSSLAKMVSTDFIDYLEIVFNCIKLFNEPVNHFFNDTSDHENYMSSDLFKKKILTDPFFIKHSKHDFLTSYEKGLIDDGILNAYQDEENGEFNRVDLVIYLYSTIKPENVTTFSSFLEIESSGNKKTNSNSLISEDLLSCISLQRNKNSIVQKIPTSAILKSLSKHINSCDENKICELIKSLPINVEERVSLCLEDLELSESACSLYILAICQSINSNKNLRSSLNNVHSLQDRIQNYLELISAYISIDWSIKNSLDLDTCFKSWKSNIERLIKQKNLFKLYYQRHNSWCDIVGNSIGKSIISALNNVDKKFPGERKTHVVYPSNPGLNYSVQRSCWSDINITADPTQDLSVSVLDGSIKENFERVLTSINKVINHKTIPDSEALNIAFYFIQVLQLDSNWPQNIFLISKKESDKNAPSNFCHYNFYKFLADKLNSQAFKDLLEQEKDILIPRATKFHHVESEKNLEKVNCLNPAEKEQLERLGNIVSFDVEADSNLSVLNENSFNQLKLNTVSSSSVESHNLKKQNDKNFSQKFFLLSDFSELQHHKFLANIYHIPFNHQAKSSVNALDLSLFHVLNYLGLNSDYFKKIGEPMYIYIHCPPTQLKNYIDQKPILRFLSEHNIIRIFGINPSSLEIYKYKD